MWGRILGVVPGFRVPLDDCMSTLSLDHDLYSALEEAVNVLRNVADFRLEQDAENRMRGLGEQKADCSLAERDEHRQLADLWRRRTLQKLQAMNVLRRLHKVAPQLVGDLPDLSDDK
jgi:hypothetical protein